MTKQEVKKIIINKYVPDFFGKKFSELKKEIYNNYLKSEYGCSEYFKDTKNGYSIFYTGNKNHLQGSKNGGGEGYFARLNKIGCTDTIKLN
jgi:hypothetical protein